MVSGMETQPAKRSLPGLIEGLFPPCPQTLFLNPSILLDVRSSFEYN